MNCLFIIWTIWIVPNLPDGKFLNSNLFYMKKFSAFMNAYLRKRAYNGLGSYEELEGPKELTSYWKNDCGWKYMTVAIDRIKLKRSECCLVNLIS